MECSCECLQKWVKWEFWFERCFGSNFIWFWSSFSVWKCLGKFWKSIWDLRGSNWDFGVKIEFFVTVNCQYSPRASKLAREASNLVTKSHVCPPRRAQLLATASIVSQGACFSRHGELLSLGGELPQFQFFCFASCVLFTYFYFELTLVINMKVFKDFICSPMALNWFENTLWILICDENPSSESWCIWRS